MLKLINKTAEKSQICLFLRERRDIQYETWYKALSLNQSLI